MVVLIVERVPPRLRGELSRWMIEPKTNVFVGRMSALVRDRLWERVQEHLRGGAAILAYPAPTEQGFTIKSCGDPTRELVLYDGLTLVRIPPPVTKAPPPLLAPTPQMQQTLLAAGENPVLW